MRIILEKVKRTNVKQEGMVSTYAADLERAPSGAQPVLSKKSVAKKLSTLMRHVFTMH